MHEVIPKIERLQAAKGDVIIRQGDPGDSLYLVLSGRLNVVSSDASGREIVLTVLEPGRTVGEISLLTGERRTATVVAVEDSQLLR